MSAENDSPHQQIEDLREFERAYRATLRNHLEECLTTLQGGDIGLLLRSAALRLAEAPGAELRAAVADLSQHQQAKLLSALLLVPVPEVTA